MTTHATESGEPESSVWMSGIATLTMLLSRTDMNMPTISTASGTIQPPSRGAGGDGTGAGAARTSVRGSTSTVRGAVLVRCPTSAVMAKIPPYLPTG